jgi:hypothetical protein
VEDPLAGIGVEGNLFCGHMFVPFVRFGHHGDTEARRGSGVLTSKFLIEAGESGFRQSSSSNLAPPFFVSSSLFQLFFVSSSLFQLSI